MSIAQTESEGGDLLGHLSNLLQPADVKPVGYPNALVWKGGNHQGGLNPVAHALTDAYALLGTVAATDILGLPFYAVPMWAQYRHDLNLEPLSWFGNMPCTSIKWSTAGDAYVNDKNGDKVKENEGGYLIIKKPWPGMMRTVHGNPQRFIDSYWEYLRP